MNQHKATRRRFLAGSTALLLAGCVESPALKNAANAIKFAFVGMPDVPISRDQVTKIPYASMSANIGRGARSLLILWRIEKGEEHWVSADNAILVTRSGRIIKTAGFPENIRGSNFLGEDPVAIGLHHLEKKLTASRTIDLDMGNHFGLPITSTFHPLGPRKITIADIDFETIYVREDNRAKTLNWNFTNHYWVDRFDGYVWKSTQTLTPGLPPAEIEILKPPARS